MGLSRPTHRKQGHQGSWCESLASYGTRPQITFHHRLPHTPLHLRPLGTPLARWLFSKSIVNARICKSLGSWRIGQTRGVTARLVRSTLCGMCMQLSVCADHDYEIRQLRIFQGMAEKGPFSIRRQGLLLTKNGIGLISRRFRPVHWSPSSRTALAAAELVYNDNHTSRSVYVKFPVDISSLSPVLQQAVQDADSNTLNLLIWTTTPWTLPANMVSQSGEVTLDFSLTVD